MQGLVLTVPSTILFKLLMYLIGVETSYYSEASMELTLFCNLAEKVLLSCSCGLEDRSDRFVF